MSTVADLPSNDRDYHMGTEVGLSGLTTAGEKATASETWIVLISDRTKFLNAVIGFPQVVGGPGGAMVRVVPLQHPEYPVLYAVSAKSRGFGFDGQKNNRFWKYTRITVDFESRPYDLSGQNAFLSLSGNPSVRTIPAPAVAFRVGGLAPVYDPGYEINGEDQVLTLHDLTSYDPTAFDSIRNHVNGGTFRGRPPGTVLYKGTSYTATSNFAGVKWDASHTLAYSEIPWNYGFLPDGTLDNVTYPDGTWRMQPADLSVLLNV